jgi:hypothetical protein
MRKIFIFLLLLTSFKLLGQKHYQFPTDSASWSYSYYMQISNTLGECSSVEHYGILGDTIINNTKYSKFYSYTQEKDSLYANNPGFCINQAKYIGAIRNDSLKVIWMEANKNLETTLFDFGLNVGDTFCFPEEVVCSKVTSIDSQLINNNEYRRAINLDEVRWVEGIGNWYGSFFGVKVMGYYEFSCQSYKDKQYLGKRGECSCIKDQQTNTDRWIIVSIDKYELELIDLDIFPNPTSGILNIEIDRDIQSCTISIYDTYGRKVYSLSKFDSDKFTCDVSHLMPNIYLITFEVGNKIKRFKLVKK